MTKEKNMHFDGNTYVAERDQKPLTTQLEKVRAIMADGEWRTLTELHRAVGSGSEAALSARLRDLRKERHGEHLVERRIREGSRTHEYRVLSRTRQGGMLFDMGGA